MLDQATCRFVQLWMGVGAAAGIIIIGVGITRPAHRNTQSRAGSEPIAASVALTANAQPNSAENPVVEATSPRAFRVLFKNSSECVRGDALTLEDGSYVIRENGIRGARIVAAFPRTSVEAIVSLSNELPGQPVQ